MQTVEQLLTEALARDGSDLHLSAGLPAMVRIYGDIHKLGDGVLVEAELRDLLFSVMNNEQREHFISHKELDFSMQISSGARFRVNVFLQYRGIAAVFRLIPSTIPGLDDLTELQIFKELCAKDKGLVLVTGSTGSGKSTTLAAMLNYINLTQNKHILTVEDPIEFLHTCQQSVINQRELNQHTKSFANSLRAALREDPDVILVGEMRDLETIRLALTAAETGHLVLATLHTSSAAKSVDRIIDVFPGEEKEMVRSMLAGSLEAVIAQRLVKKKTGGMVAAYEVMLSVPAIRNLIRENKIYQAESIMQTSQNLGMQTMEQALEGLANMGLIS